MGGRLVLELGARHPDRTLAVILIDAIVGETWDLMVQVFRLAPPLLALTGAGLLLDTLTTFPVLRDPVQARKLSRLLLPTVVGHAGRPWRLVAPGLSILRSGPTRWMLERLAQECIPVVVVHGDRDVVVPLRTARDAARRARGELVVVHGGSHSWLLKDPETLPAIMAPLLEGDLGHHYWLAVAAEGLDPDAATIDEIEDALYEPRSLVRELTPPLEFTPTGDIRYRPRYRWTHEAPT
jgi:pimeloyl-ACP methyl ester carboxylesterase